MVALKVGLDPWSSHDAVRFICYFLISTLASGCKVNLPGVTGTMSVNFLFILIGVVELTLPETMLMAWTHYFPVFLEVEDQADARSDSVQCVERGNCDDCLLFRVSSDDT